MFWQSVGWEGSLLGFCCAHVNGMMPSTAAKCCSATCAVHLPVGYCWLPCQYDGIQKRGSKLLYLGCEVTGVRRRLEVLRQLLQAKKCVHVAMYVVWMRGTASPVWEPTFCCRGPEGVVDRLTPPEKLMPGPSLGELLKDGMPSWWVRVGVCRSVT